MRFEEWYSCGEFLLLRKGRWKYLYRAVDKAGHTIDFLLTAKRYRRAAGRFLRQAIDQSDVPAKINIDKSGANTAAIEEYKVAHDVNIECAEPNI